MIVLAAAYFLHTGYLFLSTRRGGYLILSQPSLLAGDPEIVDSLSDTAVQEVFGRIAESRGDRGWRQR